MVKSAGGGGGCTGEQRQAYPEHCLSGGDELALSGRLIGWEAAR
jgi:hypothetical protein